MVRDHRQLKAFEFADSLVLSIYQATRSFPADERYALVQQLRRAGVSVAANIVEGCGRDSRADYLRFLDIAMGSLRELGYLLDLSHRLGYVEPVSAEKLRRLYEEAARTLAGLIQSNRAER